MASGIACTDLAIVVEGNEIIAKFNLATSYYTKTDCLEVVTYHKPYGGKTVIDGSQQIDKISHYISNGNFQYKMSEPDTANAKEIWFKVRPIPVNFGKKTQKFTPEWATSAHHTLDAWTETKALYDAAKKSYNSAIGSGSGWLYWKNAAEKRQYESSWVKAENNWNGAMTKAEEAAEFASECAEYAEDLNLGDTVVQGWEDAAGEYTSNAATAKSSAEYCAGRAGSSETAKLRSGYVSAAKAVRDEANAAHSNARAAAGNGDYAKAVSYEKQAVKLYKKSGKRWSDAAGTYPSGSATRDTYEGYADQCSDAAETHNGHAATYQAKVDALNLIQHEKLATPDTPSASFTVTPAWNVMIDVNCTSKWADRILVYRAQTGTGEWALVHTFTRNVPANGGEWPPAQWIDATTKRGESYRYYLVSATPSGRYSVRTDPIAGPFLMPPAQPTGFSAKLSGEDSVELTWTNVGGYIDGYVVEKSDWYENGQNAWQANAQDKITSVSVDGYCDHAFVTNLERGKTWRFRLRAKNEDNALSNYAVVKGYKNATYTYAVKVPAAPKAVPSAMTDLKAAYVAAQNAEDAYIRITWSGAALLEGEGYTIRWTTNKSAFANNVASEITEVAYDGSQGCMWSKGGLEPGKNYYFQVRKTNSDGNSARATTPSSGASRYGTYTVYAAVPAPSATLDAPTDLSAELLADNVVKLRWNDSQSVGESYDIWWTTNAQAFGNNIDAEINKASLSEYTSKTQHVYSVSGIEAGTTAWFKVRKTDGEHVSDFTQTVSKKTASDYSQIVRPTGMTARLASQSTAAVTLAWTDEDQDGAEYELQHTTRYAAFAQNAVDEIDTEDITGDVDPGTGTTARPFTITKSNLERGKKHYFRVKKSMGSDAKLANAAEGDQSRNDAYTVSLYLEPSAATLTAPTNFQLAMSTVSTTSAIATWNATQSSGESFEIQHTTNSEAFANNIMGDIETESFTDEGAGPARTFGIANLEPGSTVYVRIRKVNESGDSSAWNPLPTAAQKYVTVPPDQETMEELYAPSLAANDASYAAGDQVVLSWVHSSSEDSAQSAYQLVVNVGGKRTTYKGTTDSAFLLGTSAIADGTTVRWQVRTSGAYAGLWSPWSAVQQFYVWERPVAGVVLQQLADPTIEEPDPDDYETEEEYEEAYADYEEEVAESRAVADGKPLERLPLTVTVSGSTSGANATIGYYAEIAANSAHDTTYPDGSVRHVAAGEVLWSGTMQEGDDGFSAESWSADVSIADVTLASGQEYTARASVMTAQGLRSSAAEAEFSVEWEDVELAPVAFVSFDPSELTCEIAPACPLKEEYEPPDDDPDEGVTPVAPDEETTDEDVVSADEMGFLVAEGAYAVPTSYGQEEPDRAAWDGSLRENTVLSVYRIGADGESELIADGMANDNQSSCVDVHPTFGTCAYRILATDTVTGAQGYADFPVETPCNMAVVQWGGGKELRLPYDVSGEESYEPDVSIRQYVGREKPVAVYGARKGRSTTVGSSVRKSDSATLNMIRELGSYNGTVYVRTPSGLGFAATAKPKLSYQDSSKWHVSIDLTMVEG